MQLSVKNKTAAVTYQASATTFGNYEIEIANQGSKALSL
jgi:hypothetical protein